MSKIIKEIILGDQTITLEVGEIARQASSVLVSCDETVVLVTAVAQKEAQEGRDFFPLTVNYQERAYAAGRIPGGFLRREGRPGDHETLIARLIDRPLRPLFPKGFKNEVQVVATVMSLNPAVSPDILAIIGASAALSISGVPFDGPIGAVRVGYKEGIYQLNPPANEAKSSLNLVVAGTADAILMVESEADQLSEEIMLSAILYGHEMMQSIIRVISELADTIGNPAWKWQARVVDSAIEQRVAELAKQDIAAAYAIREKAKRQDEIARIREQIQQQIQSENEAIDLKLVDEQFAVLEKQIVRQSVLSGQPRIDGRNTKTVRPISIRTGVLPRVHGSALFTRGETQAIVAATLGNDRDAQIIDAISGDSRDRFLLHYNFPPYCVGETGMIGTPKRREIGHGKLARRAIEAVLPSTTEFPYVLRVVSEITESNGSSSMASACGTSLALMDAGVPIKAHVAGIAMGLVKEGDNFVVLSDILGDEDHLGDMDFKVAGSAEGITALQMDIKIKGITKEIMQVALEQACEGRKHILNIMEQAITKPRETLSAHAPRIQTIKIHPDKIRDVIGKGGATIKAITEETGVNIDISDEGEVQIFSADQQALELAMQRVKDIVAEVEIGKIYPGTVSKIVDFGAFVNVLPGRDGLVHISQISNERVENVNDILKEGQAIEVKVLDVDRQGRIKLSIKAISEQADNATQGERVED